MSLSEELSLKNPIAYKAHEALLAIYYTAAKLKKRADDFFAPHGLTDVQFNVMMLLRFQTVDNSGLSQAQLSDMMLVNRANVTTLIDRMEKAGLVERSTPPEDRRFNIIRLTEKGKALLDQVEPAYVAEVQRVMAVLKEAEQDKLIENMQKIRQAVK